MTTKPESKPKPKKKQGVTTYTLRDIPKEDWTEFQVASKRAGISSAKMLRMLIAETVKRAPDKS